MSSDRVTPNKRQAIRAALRKFGGNKRAAMRATNSSHRTVCDVASEPVDEPGNDGASLEPVRETERMASLLGSVEEGPPAKPEAIENDGPILAKLRKSPLTLEEIARLGQVSESTAAEWIESQRAAGINLQTFDGRWVIEKAPPRMAGPILEITSDEHGEYLLGAMGDTHLGSKYERLDVLNALYDRYEAEGVRDVFHAGNWIDGEAPFNRYDLNVHGMDGQVRYLVDQYPRRAGVHTYAVAGDDHEGWYCQKTGVNIGWYAEAAMRKSGRSDWTDLGYMEAFVRLIDRRSGQSSMLAVVHPGGGSSYALSYTIQKIVESYAGGEKPAVLFAGHYHKMELANFRNIWTVQTGCTQDQTPFMRKKRLEAHVGGHLIRLRQDPRTGAIVEMTGTMLRFFNSGYYNNRWSHAGGVNLPTRTQGGV